MRVINFMLMLASAALLPHVEDPIAKQLVISTLIISTAFYILEVVRLTVKYYIESLYITLSKQND